MKILWSVMALVVTAGFSHFGHPTGNAALSLPQVRTAPELFGKYCSGCHGKDGQAKTLKGKFSHARNLADASWQDEVSDERIFNSIMNGRNERGNMPAFNKKLSEQEAESLVRYVRGLKK